MEAEMKKHKILLVVISALMAVGMIFAAACGNGYSESHNDDSQALLDLIVDYGAAKQSYNLNEELDTSRLICAARYVNVETGAVEEPDVDLTVDEVDIDDSEFNNKVVGIYNIYVSYTHAGVTRTKSYPVEVIGTNAEFGGIVVEYSGNNRVELQAGTTTTTISSEGLTVKRVDASGNVSDTISPSDYDIELYKGTVKQDGWTVGGGAYTIRATLKSDPTISNFVSYYVIDDIDSITFDTATGVVSQAKGEDVISSTWRFTVTYKSGASKVLTAEDVTISNLDTSRTGTRKAPVIYTEFSGRGGTQTVNCRVEYTITE